MNHQIPNKTTKVLFIDIDKGIGKFGGKCPNLAIMKWSAWCDLNNILHGWNIPDPTHVIASVVFKANRHLVDGLQMIYPETEIMIGGSGYDLSTKLPDEVEAMCPDYSLYPGMDYSLGFTSRGCVRHCYFCVVPEKEGKYQRWQHPKQWVRHSKAKLLDNNWYADRDWFFETSQWFIDNKIAISPCQGLDIRLLTSEIAERIKELKFYEPIHFAYDDEKTRQAVFDGIELMKDHGMEKILRHKTFFYVYCHDDSQYESAVARCRELKEAGTSSFVMFNCENKATQRIRQLQRWANRPWAYWSFDIADYDRKGAKA